MQGLLIMACGILQSIYAFQIRSDCKSIFRHRNCELLPGDDSCGAVSHSPRIVGGKNADLGQYPWLAIVYATDNDGNETLICGGSIITSRHVLTAAHCVTDTVLPVSHVRVGEHDIRSKKDCTPQGVCAPESKNINVSSYVYHEEYNDRKYYNDIALLCLESSIDFNLYVTPICLPMPNKFLCGLNLQPNMTFDVAGWGNINSSTDQLADVLQTVSVPYVPLPECRDIFPNRQLTDHQLCAGGVKGEDSCGGDSGGPLMAVFYDRYFQFGVVSVGPSICGSGVPAIYTNVTGYLHWILDNLQK